MQETFEGVESDMCSSQRMELATVLVTFTHFPFLLDAACCIALS